MPATNLQHSKTTQAVTSVAGEKPSLERFFKAMFAYKQTAALKGAVELDLFTAIAEGKQTAEAIAMRVQASVRGIQILCDYLTVEGFLEKHDGLYALTADSAAFLDRHSPHYAGSAVDFLGHPMLMENFRDVAACVRQGGSVNPHNTVEPEHPIWAEFARSMAPLAAVTAEQVANLLDQRHRPLSKILDIAAGHGLFGITAAKRHLSAEVVAVDWKHVLSIARENAERAGLGRRYHTIEGSAFDVEFGAGYDLVLITNFIHHFDQSSTESLLRKVHAALKPEGAALAVEFVPNEDRVTPPLPAAFAFTMLCSTPAGTAYAFSELRSMFGNAGFGSIELHELPPTFFRAVTATASSGAKW